MSDNKSIAEPSSSGSIEIGAVPVILRKARDFNASRHVQIGVLPFGNDVIHNAPPYTNTDNSVSYDITFVSNADYEVYVEYAALTSRPCTLYWDSKIFGNDTMALATGGWEENFQQWEKQGVVSGVKGLHTLSISRNGVFPHIRTIKLVLING
ncbi:hypothetical protein [Pseudomonas sp. COW5]|uniref:hypothetical protein n=1 Tax=Pseudomonas sp. COW5 TaxID=2981253 RepID=UPI00224653E2|nr:hypothetical protein [Pseudomonas sp. COW5]MCX2546495.1 hypothetical protein [Pseudomonas sp. COW5]